MINDNIMDCSKNLTKQEIRNEEIINLVKRQTDYDRDTIIEKLEKWEGNYLFVIKEYINPNFNPKKKQEKKFVSKNQKVFGEIRQFMDTANKQYYKRKEREEKQKMIQQKLYLKYLKQQQKKKQETAKLETIIDETEDETEVINL